MQAKALADKVVAIPGTLTTAFLGLRLFEPNVKYEVVAFDKDTGRQIWEKKLPVNPMGIAATYEVAGKQYIVIAASAPDNPSDTEAQAAYVVFTLPASR